jgi:hypothetical protein
MVTDRGGLSQMTATAHQSTTAPARTAIPAVASLAVDPERLARMWALTPAQRVAAARRGQFTLGEMLRWAARAPAGEIPLIDGEFFFITALTATVRPDERS